MPAYALLKTPYKHRFIILLFQSLLHDPNPNSPANNEAAQLYRENRREYEKKVAAIVQESWNDDSDDDMSAMKDDDSKH